MTLSLLELQTQTVALEQKRATNTRARKAAHEARDRARDTVLETDTPDTRAAFRAALLEVEAVELLGEELDRRAASISEQIKVAQRAQDEQNAREMLNQRADAYKERKARAFELREQIAVAFEKIPVLFDELVFLQGEGDQLSDAAKTLSDERANQFGGDANVLLWQSRDTIAGDFLGFAEPVQSLFNAVAFNRSQDNRQRVLEMQRAAGEPHERDARTQQQTNDEAAALERHRQGDRDREAVFAFNNWKHGQKGAEIDAENARVAMKAPLYSFTTEQVTDGRELSEATGGATH